MSSSVTFVAFRIAVNCVHSYRVLETDHSHRWRSSVPERDECMMIWTLLLGFWSFRLKLKFQRKLEKPPLKFVFEESRRKSRNVTMSRLACSNLPGSLPPPLNQLLRSLDFRILVCKKLSVFAFFNGSYQWLANESYFGFDAEQIHRYFSEANWSCNDSQFGT